MHPLKHFMVITKHRHMVIKHCAKCGILFQGLRHDLSKYTPTEFFRGCIFFRGTKSPNEAERELNGYSVAWIHHQGRNKHHFEYWKDYDIKTKLIKPIKMPYKYVAEMFCDRLAASKVYKGKDFENSQPLSYFLNAKNTMFIHEETSNELEYLLKMLADKGEKEVFDLIKQRIKNKYSY